MAAATRRLADGTKDHCSQRSGPHPEMPLCRIHPPHVVTPVLPSAAAVSSCARSRGWMRSIA